MNAEADFMEFLRGLLSEGFQRRAWSEAEVDAWARCTPKTPSGLGV